MSADEDHDGEAEGPDRADDIPPTVAAPNDPIPATDAVPPDAAVSSAEAPDGVPADVEPHSAEGVAVEANAHSVAITRSLLPQHQSLLDASAISPEVVAARGYRSVTDKDELRALSFGFVQCSVPALLIPIHDVHGNVALHQIRPDDPRELRGKLLKYETPKGARMVIDVPPGSRASLGNPAIDLFITEGSRKADSAVTRGLCCVALLGVWNWRGKNSAGGSAAVACFESIVLKNRNVFVVFDSDVMEKKAVGGALVRLIAFVRSRGAKANPIYLPSGTDGKKVGLDDFFATGGTFDDLMRLVAPDVKRQPTEFCPYGATDHGIFYYKPTSEGTQPVQLTNFAATIVADVTEDDGVESVRQFQIEATLNGSAHTFRVSSTDFATMNWPTAHMGPLAIVAAGSGAKDHTRAAVQFLSDGVVPRTVYRHTGWREYEGESIYLHADGAIGSGGPVPNIEVRLEGTLANFALPDPPDPEDLVRDIQASLRLLDLAPPSITAPIYCATWRAAMTTSEVTVHLFGPSGGFKTEVAALMQRHFGVKMDADHLPASWTSTGNALEATAFYAKDALLVVDDFVPTSALDGVRIHREAERLIRAKANASGRARMKADTSLRPPKPPRALLLSTGEDIPRGQSLRARMIIVEIAKGAIDATKLKGCQADATSGAYGRAMSGFIRWLASFRRKLLARLPDALASLRDELRADGAHCRTPEAIADLLIGLKCFLAFAIKARAIDQNRATEIQKSCRDALVGVGEQQAGHVAEYDVARRFVGLLGTAITTRRAYVLGVDGSAPPIPSRWGWSPDGLTTPMSPASTLVGWLDGNALYLDFTAAIAVVQKLAKETGEDLPFSVGTIKQRLDDAQLIIEKDTRGGALRRDVRKTIQGVRRNVVVIPASAIISTESPPENDAPTAPPTTDTSRPTSSDSTGFDELLQDIPVDDGSAT